MEVPLPWGVGQLDVDAAATIAMTSVWEIRSAAAFDTPCVKLMTCGINSQVWGGSAADISRTRSNSRTVGGAWELATVQELTLVSSNRSSSSSARAGPFGWLEASRR